MTPDHIRRAAEVLRDEALCLKESYGRPPEFEWPANVDDDSASCKAREDHDEMLALAAGLERLALDGWTAAADSLPDSDITVMVFDPTADEPVWLGFVDGEGIDTSIWRFIDGSEASGVTHWRPIIEGPTT